MKRSAGDDNSVTTTMTNGFGSPPKIEHMQQQLRLQQEQERRRQLEHGHYVSDYFGSSVTKASSNPNNVNGAAQLVGQVREESANVVATAAQRSPCRVPAAEDIRVPKSAFNTDLTRDDDIGEQPSETNVAIESVEKSVVGGSAISNAADETRNSSLQSEKPEAEMNHDDDPREEPDEIPCLMPFISVDSIEDLVDPLMDTDEPSDRAAKMCHNGDSCRMLNDDGVEENDDASSVEFVSHESAIADASSSVDAEINAPLDKRRRLPEFRCNECQHSFDTESELELHTQSLDVALLCAQCESSFWSPCALNRHKSEHASAMQQIAYASGYHTDSGSPYQHGSGSFADKPHACKHCGAGYTTKFNLMRHVRKNVVWLKNGEPYKCELCDATFLAKCLLPIHKQEKHAEFMELDAQVTPNSLNYVETSLEPEAESVIVTPQFDLLGECDPLEEESRPIPSTSYHTFRTATASGISYNCKWCPEKVPTHPALIKHIREEHPDVELFRCEPCNKTFLNKAGLYGHLTHHRFQCDKCDLNFSTEDFLRQHRVIHGDDPASFLSSSSLSTSQRTSSTSAIASKPPSKPSAPRSKFSKSKCEGMPYFELLARVPHMRKPFECEFCDKKFTYKTTFLEHHLTHTGERPFRCSVCGQGFIRERAMEMHESSHGVVLQRTAAQPVQQPESVLLTPSPFTEAAKNFIVINGRRQTARKSTNAVARPSNRINPIGRAIINGALFDPELDVTPEDREAFYFLPIVGLKMVDVSSLEDHAYVCPYCDKFFPRATSLCGHKKICSYLTRMRAQKASAAATGTPMTIVPRKWTPRIAGVSSVAAGSANASSSRLNFYVRPEESSVMIANMRHHIVFEGGERIFVCGVCGKQFARKFTLSEHCRSHTTDRPFNCDRCPRAFKRKSSLFRHRRRNHAKVGAVLSGYDIPNDASSAQHPMADQNWMSFEPQCNVKIEFSDDDEDDDDEDDDTPGEEDDYKPSVDLTEGEYPGDQANFQYDYSEMSVFEPQCIVKDEVSSDEENSNSNSNSNCNYYPVADCDLIDTSMNHFLEVGLTNNGETSRDEDEELDDVGGVGAAPDNAWAELEYERLEHQQEQQLAAVNRFLCGECNRRFPRREDLRRHFAEHDSVGPYKCFYCDKTFDRRKYLSKHARNHGKKKSYQCSYCERAYVTNAELTIHVRIHTGERPFECDQCGKGFRVQKQLTLHYRTHTGEKPYSCTYCPSTFSRHETLFRHNRVCQTKNGPAAKLAPLAQLATPQLSQLLQQPPPPPLMSSSSSPPPPPHSRAPQPNQQPRLADVPDASTSPNDGRP